MSRPVSNSLRPSTEPLEAAEPSSPAATKGNTAPHATTTNQIVPHAGGAMLPAGREPAALEVGTMDYYVRRHQDFLARNPGVTPPDYYLAYGMKYLESFSKLDHGDLSPDGLAWRSAARTGLQRAIEAKRAEDPEAFAKLERDPDAFRAFAYATHATAYIEAGLLELPAQDLLKILVVPDLRDLLNADGFAQVLDVLERVRPDDLATILEWTGNEALRDYSRASDGLADWLSRAGVKRFLSE